MDVRRRGGRRVGGSRKIQIEIAASQRGLHRTPAAPLFLHHCLVNARAEAGRRRGPKRHHVHTWFTRQVQGKLQQRGAPRHNGRRRGHGEYGRQDSQQPVPGAIIVRRRRSLYEILHTGASRGPSHARPWRCGGWLRFRYFSLPSPVSPPRNVLPLLLARSLPPRKSLQASKRASSEEAAGFCEKSRAATPDWLVMVPGVAIPFYRKLLSTRETRTPERNAPGPSTSLHYLPPPR